MSITKEAATADGGLGVRSVMIVLCRVVCSALGQWLQIHVLEGKGAAWC